MNARRASEGRSETRGGRHDDDEEDVEDEEVAEEDDYEDFGDYDEEFEDGDESGPRRGAGRPRREWSGGGE